MPDIKHSPFGISVDESPLAGDDINISPEGVLDLNNLIPQNEIIDDFTINGDNDNFFGMEVEKLPVITSNSYDPFRLYKEAEKYLNEIGGFLFPFGRIDNVNMPKVEVKETEGEKVKTGTVHFSIRLVSDALNRMLFIDIPIPIREGKFEKPLYFKSGSKKYGFSSDGIKQAFNLQVEMLRKRQFPDFRKSRRWPTSMPKYIDYEF